MVINKDGLITENQNTQDNKFIIPEVIETEKTLENDFDLNSNQEKKEENIDKSEQTIETGNASIDETSSKDCSSKEDTVETNCLALTVRKDYNLSIVKNSIFTTLRLSWKVALSTFVLNILKLFF